MTRCSCCKGDATARCLLATHNGVRERTELLCDSCQRILSEVGSVSSLEPMGTPDDTAPLVRP